MAFILCNLRLTTANSPLTIPIGEFTTSIVIIIIIIAVLITITNSIRFHSISTLTQPKFSSQYLFLFFSFQVDHKFALNSDRHLSMPKLMAAQYPSSLNIRLASIFFAMLSPKRSRVEHTYALNIITFVPLFSFSSSSSSSPSLFWSFPFADSCHLFTSDFLIVKTLVFPLELFSVSTYLVHAVNTYDAPASIAFVSYVQIGRPAPTESLFLPTPKTKFETRTPSFSHSLADSHGLDQTTRATKRCTLFLSNSK